MDQSEIDLAEYLNVGCGTVRMNNCINMDIAKNVFVDVDIVGSVLAIPFPAERFKGIIFSHVLEHLSKAEHKTALLEIRRVLKPKGTLYIEVPDFPVAIKYYLTNYKGRRDYWYQCIYGRETYTGDTHKSGISEQYLTDLLFELGYAHLKWIDIGQEQAILGVIAQKDSLPEIRI